MMLHRMHKSNWSFEKENDILFASHYFWIFNRHLFEDSRISDRECRRPIDWKNIQIIDEYRLPIPNRLYRHIHIRKESILQYWSHRKILIYAGVYYHLFWFWWTIVFPHNEIKWFGEAHLSPANADLLEPWRKNCLTHSINDSADIARNRVGL